MVYWIFYNTNRNRHLQNQEKTNLRVRGPYWGWGEGEIGEGRTNYEDIVSNDLVHPG